MHSIAISDNYIAIPQYNASNRGILVFNNRTGSLFKIFSNPSPYTIYHYHVEISELENLLYATTSHGNVDIFSLESGKLIRSYSKICEFANACSAVIGNGRRNFAYDGRKMTEFFSDGSTGKVINLGDINKVTLSPNGELAIASDGAHNAVDVYDLDNGKKVYTFKPGFHVYCAVMSPNGRFIACGGYGNIVKVYNIHTKKYKEIAFPIDGSSVQGVHSLNFSPNGKYLAIGEHTSGYSIYSIDEDKVIHREKVNGCINEVLFTNNNRIIINAYYNVYNMPVPMMLTITSHTVGVDIATIEYPLDDKSSLPYSSNAIPKIETDSIIDQKNIIEQDRKDNNQIVVSQIENTNREQNIDLKQIQNDIQNSLQTLEKFKGSIYVRLNKFLGWDSCLPRFFQVLPYKISAKKLKKSIENKDWGNQILDILIEHRSECEGWGFDKTNPYMKELDSFIEHLDSLIDAQSVPVMSLDYIGHI